MSSFARAERNALIEQLTSLGPTAPTMCEGWTTYDLAAHLVTRERSPQALAGLVVPPLHGLTAAAEERTRQTSYDELVALLRQGPPRWSPVAPPGPLYDVANLHEFYVHHEDVRRAQPGWQPRDLPELDGPLWQRLPVFGRASVRRATGLRFRLVTPGAQSMTLGRGSSEVVLRGTPRELFLWLLGRRTVARVEVEASPEVRAKADSAALGI